MIGLTIRTLVIILMLSSAPTSAIRYAVMVCTAVTTICGMWLAYGEPPNLIMAANLYPFLGNDFFLLYCAPAAIMSYLIIAWNLRKRLGGQRIALEKLDVLDANVGDMRFLQATRHGEVITPVELVENHAHELGPHTERVLERIRAGEALGKALVREHVPQSLRRKLLSQFVSEGLADSLDRHYVLDVAGDREAALKAEHAVDAAILALAPVRRRAQKIGALSLLPFLAMLIVHAFGHRVPLFLASLAGFFAALMGIVHIPKMRALALREAR